MPLSVRGLLTSKRRLYRERMNPFKEFADFEGKAYAATTKRVYLSAARNALKIVGQTPDTCGSYEELLALLRENLRQKNLPKGLRIAPFLRFLHSKIPKKPENIPDYGPIRAWVINHIEKETRETRKALHFIRRDLAMLACLCVAPEQGSPRRWPKGALTIARKGGVFKVKLWDKPVEAPGLALAILYWDTCGERLTRPERGRHPPKAWLTR